LKNKLPVCHYSVKVNWARHTPNSLVAVLLGKIHEQIWFNPNWEIKTPKLAIGTVGHRFHLNKNWFFKEKNFDKIAQSKSEVLENDIRSGSCCVWLQCCSKTKEERKLSNWLSSHSHEFTPKSDRIKINWENKENDSWSRLFFVIFFQ
jgi:hypothetical protein